MDAEKKDEGWHLPSWVRDITKRVLYVVVPMLVLGSIALFSDNIANKGDIRTNTIRNDQQDELIANTIASLKRLETRQDRAEERAADKQKEDQEFQSEVLERLRKLLTGKRG